MPSRANKMLMLALPLAGIIWLLLIGSLQSRWIFLRSITQATYVVHENATHLTNYEMVVEKYLKSLEDINGAHAHKALSPISESTQVPSVEIITPVGHHEMAKEPTQEEEPAELQPQEIQETKHTLTPLESAEKVGKYVQSILDPSDTTFERMQCPVSVGSRYQDLKKSTKGGTVKYFVALDLYKVEELLPRLMSSIVEVLKYLGPENCAISVVEGRSTDLTYDVLAALKPKVESMGAHFYLGQSDINPLGGELNRIAALAMLRNLALAPLNDSRLFDNETVIVFSNDIASCPEDILELLYQHKYQDATMTCSMDWIHDGDLFYDIWVSRGINGDLFFEVPQDSSWAYSGNLFWNHEPSKKRFEALQPFQVYACWGGMVTLAAQPFIDGNLTFRVSEPDECYEGEPTLLAMDMWKLGEARIATVPIVAVGYSNDEGGKIKKRRGYVSDHADMEKPGNEDHSEKIEWKGPPGMVKCAPEWQRQTWVNPISGKLSF